MIPIRVLVNGSKGKMGQEAVKAIKNDPDLLLAAQAGRGDDLKALIEQTATDVVVDLTTADAVYANANMIIDSGVHPVIGTSGLLPDQIAHLRERCEAKQLGGLIVPNFSIGAVLMMKYAADAARYWPGSVEIIELHHPAKQDSPSGTAIKTAQLIKDNRLKAPTPREEREIIPHARGADIEGIHLHSVRLPGLLAHQEVIFGALGETLTIRHDSFHRESFMPGLLLSCKKVMTLRHLIYGLEGVL